MKISLGGLEVPNDTVVLPERDAFEEDSYQAIDTAAQKITSESAKRKELRKDGGSEPWAPWVRPICYRFIEHCLEYGYEGALRRRLSAYNRHTSSDDIFSVGLLAIFAGDQANFTEPDRHKLSRQLWYAYRHYVPWQFLNGFLSQLSNFEQQKALARIEPGFEDWIIMRRSVDYSTRKYRGNYPAGIEQGARSGTEALLSLAERARRTVD